MPRLPADRMRSERGGRRAEGIAALYLRLKGYRILARRFRTPVGEIDLIVRKGEVVVFVEVKRRRQHEAALEALEPRQRQRIARAAEAFLQQRPRFRQHTCRFDVIALSPWSWPAHLENAWQL